MNSEIAVSCEQHCIYNNYKTGVENCRNVGSISIEMHLVTKLMVVRRYEFYLKFRLKCTSSLI